jgi:hypothetical protein
VSVRRRTSRSSRALRRAGRELAFVVLAAASKPSTVVYATAFPTASSILRRLPRTRSASSQDARETRSVPQLRMPTRSQRDGETVGRDSYFTTLATSQAELPGRPALAELFSGARLACGWRLRPRRRYQLAAAGGRAEFPVRPWPPCRTEPPGSAEETWLVPVHDAECRGTPRRCRNHRGVRRGGVVSASPVRVVPKHRVACQAERAASGSGMAVGRPQNWHGSPWSIRSPDSLLGRASIYLGTTCPFGPDRACRQPSFR